MENWLVTVDHTITNDEAIRRFIIAGAAPDAEADVILLDDTERAITVFATASVAATLSDFSWVSGVFPNSEMQVY